MSSIKDEFGLKPKHHAFVLEYVQNGLDEMLAYKKVYGCNERTARNGGARLLASRAVKRYLKKYFEEREAESAVTVSWIEAKLKEMVERCMQAEPVMVFNPETKEMVESGIWRFDSGGANKALELLGKYHRMFVERQQVQHSGRVSYTQIFDHSSEAD